MHTQDNSNNVAIPNYVYDEQLRVYREVFPPKNELFKSVGHNSQELVREIMTLMNKVPASAARSAKLKPFGSKLAQTLAAKMKKDLDKKKTGKLVNDVTKSELIKSDSFK